MKFKRLAAAALLATFALSGTAHASLKCFKDPAGGNTSYAQGMNREGARDSMMQQMQDPAQDLLMCFMQTSFQGPQSVLKHCGCKEAVEELCEFDWKNGKLHVTAKGGAKVAWCTAFAPAMI